MGLPLLAQLHHFMAVTWLCKDMEKAKGLLQPCQTLQAHKFNVCHANPVRLAMRG